MRVLSYQVRSINIIIHMIKLYNVNIYWAPARIGALCQDE